MKKHRKHVILLIETSNSYCRGILRGVHSYIQEHRSWTTCLTELGRGDPAPAWVFENLQGDGIIARIENRRTAQAVLKTGLPVIDVSAARTVPNLPWVETDDQKIATLAFHHFTERGIKQLAFCGHRKYNWSNWREAEFVRLCESCGIPCSVFGSYPSGHPAPTNLAAEEKELVIWLESLSKPVGVFACYDLRGQQLLDICRRLGISVPDQVAVIGVDNDELFCELSDPPLSSIIPDTHRTGYEAAQMLDLLMAGKSLSDPSRRIPPLGVATRQSTDIMAVADKEISQVLKFIRDHARDGIKVEDILKVVPISRRILEHRFKRLLGCTPHDEIVRARFGNATKLLLETSLPLETVAKRAGFQDSGYFSFAFKQYFGMAPSNYRKTHRLK